MEHRVHFNKTTDFVQGGLIENVDVEIRNARYDFYDYNGKAPKEVLAFKCDLHEIMKDGSVSDVPASDAVWSMGNPDGMMPIEDGRFIGAQHEGASLKKGSNFFVFFETLERLGFSDVDGDAHAFNGLQMHVVRIPAPKRDGLDMHVEGEREKKIMVASAIIRNPNDKRSRGAASRKPAASTASTASSKPAASAPAAAPAAEGSDDLFNKIVELATKLNTEGKIKEGPVSAFRAALIRAATTDKWEVADRNTMSGMLKDADELSSIVASIGGTVDGDTIII